MRLPWSKVEAGMTVTLKGRDFSVARAKVKGKRVKVMLEAAGGTFKSEVRAKDEVDIASARPAKITKRSPLRDETGAQQRWATTTEHKSTLKPPVKASGGEWDEPKGKAERVIMAELPGAKLVGEATDEKTGWYVPPVDPSTVAAHLFLFHEAELDHLSPTALMDFHDNAHRAAVDTGEPLAVNHWHTKERP